MVSRKELEEYLYSKFKFNQKTEIINIQDAQSRTAAKDIFSENTLPNQQTSALDGIAYSYENFLKKDTSLWKEGEDYIYANTGIAIPDIYDTVSPVEYINVVDNVLEITEKPSQKGETVNPAGSILKSGEKIIEEGTVIRPQHLALLASAGIEKIEVIKKPLVAIIPTGNELVDRKMPLPKGKNVESNSVMFKAFVEKWGGEAKIYPIIPDDRQLLERTLEKASKEADIIIFNAGSSLGTKDFTSKVFESVGKIIFNKVKHGPAYPTCFAVANEKPVLGIVGPTLGAEITTYFYLRPLMDNYLKRPKYNMEKIEVKIMDDYEFERPLDFYERVKIKKDGEIYRAWKVSGRANITNETSGLMMIKSGQKAKKGDIMTAELIVEKEYL